MTEMVHRNILLPDDMDRKIATLAAAQGKSPNELINALISEALEQHTEIIEVYITPEIKIKLEEMARERGSSIEDILQPISQALEIQKRFIQHGPPKTPEELIRVAQEMIASLNATIMLIQIVEVKNIEEADDDDATDKE